MKTIINNKYFQWSVTFAIVLNFVVLYLQTEGIDTLWWEDAILTYFIVELVMKLAVLIKDFWKDNWNNFDFVVVALGVLPWLGVPLPASLAGLRTLRLLRVLSVVPAFRDILNAIGRSLVGVAGVFGTMMVMMAIAALMATMSFQPFGVEGFMSFKQSLFTLLQLSTFDEVGTYVGAAGAANPLGAWLTFTFFFIGVVLLSLNMIIGILGNALSDEDELAAELAEIKQMLKELSKKK